MRVMRQGSERPLDIRDPHLFLALGSTTNLVIWELLRRFDRPSTVEDLVAAAASETVVAIVMTKLRADISCYLWAWIGSVTDDRSSR